MIGFSSASLAFTCSNFFIVSLKFSGSRWAMDFQAPMRISIPRSVISLLSMIFFTRSLTLSSVSFSATSELISVSSVFDWPSKKSLQAFM